MLLAALLVAGCKRDASPPPADAAAPAPKLAQADAGATDAGGPVDRTLRPVGEVRTQLFKPYVLDGGRLVFVAHALAWEAKADGSIAVVGGAPEAFSSLLPDDESLVGYGTSPRHPQMVAAAASGGVQLFYETQGAPRSYVLAGGKATPADARANVRAPEWKGRRITFDHWQSDADKKLLWVDGAADPPPKVPTGVRLQDLFVGADGALVGIGLRNVVAPIALVWTAPDAEPIERTFSPQTQSCQVVPSFDRRLYVSCIDHDVRRMFVLGKDGWERAFPDAGEIGYIASVSSDGTLYETEPKTSKLAVVQSCPKTGACTTLADLAATKTSEGASYEVAYTDAQESSSGRTWATFSVQPRNAVPAYVIQSIFARASDDLWVVTKSSDDVYVLHHSGPERARTIMPGTNDERVLVRDTKPPTKWVGHCDQIFVRLGRDGEAAQKRLTDIKAVLDAGKHDESAYGISYGWDLVEGRLEGRPVVGVVLHRADVEASLAAMERAATKLIDKLAANPVDRPDAFCTLPVLTKKLAGG